MNRFIPLIVVLLLILHTPPCFSSPSQFGGTGLLNLPVAETLNAGNICLGLWGAYNSDSKSSESAAILPVGITLGLGTFMEAYGSFPNLLFNDEELDSGRGYANLGLKLRLLGQRSSPFQLSIDAQGRKTISNDPVYEGLTDLVGRLIGSYKPADLYGIHGNVGFVKNDSPAGISYENQMVFGAGLEYLIHQRLKVIAEYEGLTEKVSDQGYLAEGTAGIQYHLSPHLTFNLGLGLGLSDQVPDWKLLVGLSTCQGVGSYLQPIPKIVEDTPPVETKEEQASPRIKVLTPLIPGFAVSRSEVFSRFEIPVKEAEEVALSPLERLPIEEGSNREREVSAVASIGGLAQTKPEGGQSEAKMTQGFLYRKFLLPEVTFDFDQWSLSDEGKRAVSEIAELMRKDDHWVVLRIDGHTDAQGSARYNEKLSLRRAIAFASHFVTHAGIAPERIYVKGHGEAQPLASNDTQEGRSKNRRVELLVLTQKGSAR